MFAAAQKASNGVTVQYNDAGVVYTHNGHSMSFEGEYACGEVFVDNKLHAYYERDEVTVLRDEQNNVVATLQDDEGSYEAYALRVLQTL